MYYLYLFGAYLAIRSEYPIDISRLALSLANVIVVLTLPVSPYSSFLSQKCSGPLGLILGRFL